MQNSPSTWLRRVRLRSAIRTSSMALAYRLTSSSGAAILLDYADESHRDFDEILIEKNRYGAIWLHFAVRPKGNRRKVLSINV